MCISDDRVPSLTALTAFKHTWLHSQELLEQSTDDRVPVSLVEPFLQAPTCLPDTYIIDTSHYAPSWLCGDSLGTYVSQLEACSALTHGCIVI